MFGGKDRGDVTPLATRGTKTPQNGSSHHPYRSASWTTTLEHGNESIYINVHGKRGHHGFGPSPQPPSTQNTERAAPAGATIAPARPPVPSPKAPQSPRPLSPWRPPKRRQGSTCVGPPTLSPGCMCGRGDEGCQCQCQGRK